MSEQSKSGGGWIKGGVNENFNSMAPKEEDMKKLGKEMSSMPTNSQIEQQGLVPDPSQ